MAARDWYYEKNAKAANALLQELDHAVYQIRSAPNRWPKFETGTRRYVFPRFPFNLIYIIKNDKVQVLAVAHQRRKPGFWSSRA